MKQYQGLYKATKPSSFTQHSQSDQYLVNEAAKLQSRGKPVHKKSLSESKIKVDQENTSYNLFNYHPSEDILNVIMKPTGQANNQYMNVDQSNQSMQDPFNSIINGQSQTIMTNSNPNSSQNQTNNDGIKNMHLPFAQDNDDDGDQLINEINNRIEISSPIEQSPEFQANIIRQPVIQPKEVKNQFLLNINNTATLSQPAVLSVSPQPQVNKNVIYESKQSITPPKISGNGICINDTSINQPPPNMPINIHRPSYTPPPQTYSNVMNNQTQQTNGIQQQQQLQYSQMTQQQSQQFSNNVKYIPDLLTPQINQAKNRPIILPDNLERYSGTLKFFDENRNYGFIVMDMDMSDIFVHYDDIAKANISKDLLKLAKHGERIRFTFSCMNYIGKYNKSRKAVELQLISNNIYDNYYTKNC